ncbi:MAG: hypothetical protein AAB587_00425 [Patescibacteria group bacterium]
MEEERPQKKKGAFWRPIIAALCVDLLQMGVNLLNFIPVIGMIIAVSINFLVSVFALLGFYTYFKIRGVNFGIPRKLLGFGGGVAIEIMPIPLLSALPGWTIAVALAAGKEK